MQPTEHSSAMLDNAASILSKGGLVAFPTETVYGLGADARNPRALLRIFQAKGRPVDHPLIVHIAKASEIKSWATDIPDIAWQLAEKFWPGPLTLILKRQLNVSDLVTGRQDTVGLRMPAHPLALALLERFGSGIAAPSANRYGRVSPTTAEHVAMELGDSVDLILDGGACSVGLESTILDLSSAMPQLLRPGAVTRSDLLPFLGQLASVPKIDSPRVSGSTPSHYAPFTPVQLIEKTAVQALLHSLIAKGKAVAVLAIDSVTNESDSKASILRMPADARNYAQALYAQLRVADALACQVLLIEQPPESEQWDAVRDRLTRAAHGSKFIDSQNP